MNVCYTWNFSTPPFICRLIFQGERCFIQHGGVFKGLQLSKRKQVESYKALQSVVGTWASWPNCSRLFTAIPCLVPFHFHWKWFRFNVANPSEPIILNVHTWQNDIPFEDLSTFKVSSSNLGVVSPAAPRACSQATLPCWEIRLNDSLYSLKVSLLENC